MNLKCDIYDVMIYDLLNQLKLLILVMCILKILPMLKRNEFECYFDV